MTKSTPVTIDGRDVILRDKYRAIVAEYSSEIVEILQAVKYDTEADTARLVKCVRDLDNARQQLLNIEVKLSYEESKSKETCGETDIDFDAMRQSIGRRLDRLRRAQGPKRLPKGADIGLAARLAMDVRVLGHGASIATERRLAHLGDLGRARRGQNPGRIGMDPADGRGQPAQNAGPLRAGGAVGRDFGSSP